jgi:hypothetical protein
MSNVAVQDQIEPMYLNKAKTAEYARSLGAENVKESTIHNAAYRLRTLARPKIIGGVAYWTKADVEAWLESL